MLSSTMGHGRQGGFAQHAYAYFDASNADAMPMLPAPAIIIYRESLCIMPTPRHDIYEP